MKPLTFYQSQILRLCADGMTYSEIGDQLGRDYRSISNAASRARTKLSAKNITQAVAIATREDLI